MEPINLYIVEKAYLIGIKGSGMAAVAEIFKKRGIEVSGSDTEEKFYTDEILKKNNIPFVENFSADNVPQNVDLIIHSTAYSEENNPEVAEAKNGKTPVLSYPEVIGLLIEEKVGIAVCGTHGKTTTTAILAEALNKAGADPGAIVGSKVLEWGSSALGGEGKYFVAEADEYQNKFEHYRPFAAVLTTIDWDHPDFFPTFDEYKETFKNFVAKIPHHGFLVVWGDSDNTLEIAQSAKCDVITYGFGKENDIMAELAGDGMFTVKRRGKKLGDFSIQLPGDHNILNATAAIAACYKLNMDLEKAGEGIGSFRGTARRFEFIGERNGAILIDDYAHHPEEARVTLRAARKKYPGKKITTIFHPHTFTRTKALMDEFSQSFSDTDRVIVIDIYGSAREKHGGVSSDELVEKINKFESGKAEYIPTIKEVIEYLKNEIGSNDVVMSMGAGNVWEITHKLKE